MPNNDLHTAGQLFESAMMYLNNGDKVTAAQQLQAALILDPDHHLAFNNRGLALLGMGHPFDCVLHMDRAIALKPEPAYYSNRGAAYYELAKYDKALGDYDTAIALQSFPEAHNNRGNVLGQLGRAQEAKGAYRAALECNPDYVDAHLNLSFLELADGNFKQGWEGYEWRWKSSQMVPRGLGLPVWEGETIANPEEGLLLYSEQGHGDALQFCRYAALAKKVWGGKVYVEIRAPLKRLLQTLEGIDGIVAYGEKLPDNVTHQQALMSCPRILGTTVETIPATIPYLGADPGRVANWRKNIADLPNNYGRNLLVGACWAGMSRTNQPIAAAVDARRSTKFDQWGPLARVPGITWVSLQKGPPAEQVQKPPVGAVVVDWTEELDDWFDTAALISCLDLVVTVDTAVAHLAGALGKPVWVLSRADGCWRWMGHKPTSPWYPTMRLFHQPTQGDWAAPISEAARALRKMVMAPQQARVA